MHLDHSFGLWTLKELPDERMFLFSEKFDQEFYELYGIVWSSQLYLKIIFDFSPVWAWDVWVLQGPLKNFNPKTLSEKAALDLSNNPERSSKKSREQNVNAQEWNKEKGKCLFQ